MQFVAVLLFKPGLQRSTYRERVLLSFNISYALAVARLDVLQDPSEIYSSLRVIRR